MAGIRGISAINPKNPNDNQYTGLKTALGYTAVTYGIKLGIKNGLLKIMDKGLERANTGLANLKNPLYINSCMDSVQKAEKEKELLSATKNLPKIKETLQNFKPSKSTALMLPISLGCGLLVDYLNNKQRKNSEPNAVTKEGNEYTKVNMGKKNGFKMGVAVQAGLMAAGAVITAKRSMGSSMMFEMTKNAAKELPGKIVNAVKGLKPSTLKETIKNIDAVDLVEKSMYKGVAAFNFASPFIVYGLGGRILGSIADRAANKKAAKLADAQAVSE